MNIEQIAALYIAEKRRTRRANTCDGYESALRRHVLPRWGSMRVEDVEPADIQDWIDGFDLPGAAEKAWKTLRQVIRWAIRKLGVRAWDPTTAGVELPRRRRREPRTLDAAQAAAFLRGLWGCPHEAAALFSVSLGLRPGEVRGLRWGDVDWRTGEVRIERTCVFGLGGWHEYEPKTERSRRTLVLPPFALRRLRALRGGRAERVVAEGDLTKLGRAIKAWCSRRGVPWVPLQNLRHTWATLAVEAGVGIETVSMLLGHADIGTAYEHYVRPRRSIAREVQRAVQELVMRCSK